jgi:rare lipoprotein A
MRIRGIVGLLLILLVVGCSTADGPVRPAVGGCAESGLASWYRTEDGHLLTANGEHYRPDTLTAAHRFLPFGTEVLVTSLATGRSVIVRINDRGPFVAGRIIDLSSKAARLLGMQRDGVIRVRLQIYAEPAGSLHRCQFRGP